METTVRALTTAMETGCVVCGRTDDFYVSIYTETDADHWEVFRISVTPRISMDINDDSVISGSMAATCRYRTDAIAFLRRFGIGTSKRIWEQLA